MTTLTVEQRQNFARRLAAATVPDDLVVTSRTGDGEVMGVRHLTYPIEGVQFHPESVLTPQGPEMARNFLT